MMFKNERPLRIVLIGGGYVTVHAYRSLSKLLAGRLRRGEVRVTVICPNNGHDFHGWTGEALEGIISIPNRLSPVRDILPLARVVSGEAVSVDLVEQTVAVRVVGMTRIEQVAFDHLIIGTGSRDSTESIPGLRRYGIPLKGPGEVLGLRNHLVRTLEQADAVTDPALRERLLTIVIAGGGFAGVEMAAAIAGLMRHERRNYPVLRRHGFRMVLAHGGEDILPQLRPRYEKLAEYAAEQLTAQGVWIRRETRVVNVTEEGAVFDDGSVLRSATVISTLGQMRTILPGTESFARTPDNRIMADRELRVRGRPNIWVGGDIADVEHPRNGEPCPANALWAIKHGEHAGANIARTLRGQPLRPFSFPGLGQAASFGVGKGITELYGMQFTGWVAWAMRLGLFEYFMPSRKQAVRVALDWLTLPILGRHGESLEATAPGEHAYASERPVEDPPAYAAVEVDDPEQEQTVNGYQAAKA